MEIQEYRPGALGRMVELHAAYYSEAAGFGAFFEAKVASEMAAFLQDYRPGMDGMWTMAADGAIEGGVAIQLTDRQQGHADLRWFILSERVRGKGMGSALLERALRHCRDCGMSRVTLWTFAGLHAARTL